jgi:lipopolysaccharide/colanic/teichoic acid biosynthesis glycosyltransferase
MLLHNILKKIPRLLQIQKELSDTVATREDFHKIILRERARIDRNGRFFSLVDFDIRAGDQFGSKFQCLLQLLIVRIRVTDELGWLNEHHIGVLLHDTAGDGAFQFAKEIYDRAAGQMPALEYSIYTYPDHNENSENKNSASENHPTKSSHTESDKKKLDNLTKINCQKQFETVVRPQRSITGVKAGQEISAKKMHSLFVRKIPVWKRSLDLVGAICGLLIFSPLILLTGFLIKIVSRGSVILKQKRIGAGGKIFLMWKFRTMHVNSDPRAHKQYLKKLIHSTAEEGKNIASMTKIEDASQIIPFGKVLRNSALDEIPQLINVLRGEMSLVGPRPPIPYEVNEYRLWHTGRLDATPGMTGLWQVSGKNRLSFREMVRLDIRYSRTFSLLSDIKILLMTPMAIVAEIIYYKRKHEFSQKGVEGHA